MLKIHLRKPPRFSVRFRRELSAGADRYDEGYEDGKKIGYADGENAANAIRDAQDTSRLAEINTALAANGAKTAKTLDDVDERIPEVYDRGSESGKNSMREEMDALITRELTKYENDTITYVGSSAFRDCEKLASVKLPNLRTVDYYAFRECDSLTEIDFPMLTEMVGAYPFVKCYALRRVNLPLVKNLSQGAFDYCTALEEINCPNVESTVEGTYAFRETKLTQIDLPKATDIPQGMFEICRNLKSVNAPLAKSVGSYAFNACESLETLNLSATKSIGQQAFNGCTSLKMLHLPSVESVSAYGMRGCTELAVADLPKCKTIGEYAFQSCPKLQSVDLSSVEMIGAHAFQDIASLTNIHFPDDLPDVGEWAFYGCKVEGKLTFGSYHPVLRNLTIGSGAFRMCSLTNINLQAHSSYRVTLGSSCFGDNKNLTSVVIGGADTIPNSAFIRCSLLASVDLFSVESIEPYAFGNCGNLKRLNLYGSKMTKLADTTSLVNCPATIYVPSGLLYKYKTDAVWSNYANRIVSMDIVS